MSNTAAAVAEMAAYNTLTVEGDPLTMPNIFNENGFTGITIQPLERQNPLQMNDLQKNTGESQKTNCLLSQYLTNSNPWTHGICRKDTLKDKRAFPLN